MGSLKYVKLYFCIISLLLKKLHISLDNENTKLSQIKIMKMRNLIIRYLVDYIPKNGYIYGIETNEEVYAMRIYKC